MSHGEILEDPDPVLRFRLSIRLEAWRRVLRKEWGIWWRQLAVWVMSFTEVSAIAVVPGPRPPFGRVSIRHYGSAASHGQLSCWRGSFLDPFLQPVHVLRPKHDSRFGLGEHQRASSFFGVISLGIRLACSVAFTAMFFFCLQCTVLNPCFVQKDPWGLPPGLTITNQKVLPTSKHATRKATMSTAQRVASFVISREDAVIPLGGPNICASRPWTKSV